MNFYIIGVNIFFTRTKHSKVPNNLDLIVTNTEEKYLKNNFISYVRNYIIRKNKG